MPHTHRAREHKSYKNNYMHLKDHIKTKCNDNYTLFKQTIVSETFSEVFKAKFIYSRTFYFTRLCMSQPLKRQAKIAADDTLFFYFYLSEEIRLDVSCESSV